ncbi:MAG: hypothetical protein WEB56_14535 [Roseovarius sp.]
MEMPLLLILAGVTLVLAIGVALWSKRATDKRMRDHDQPKSTLAADADSKGKPADVE